MHVPYGWTCVQYIGTSRHTNTHARARTGTHVCAHTRTHTLHTHQGMGGNPAVDSDVEAAFGDTSAHSFPLSALPPPDDRLWATPPPFPPPEHDVIGASSSKASPVDLPKSRNPADRIAHVHAIDQDQGGGIS